MWYEMMTDLRAYVDKKLAEQEAKKQAEANSILESWKAGKERDQALITKIKTEAASRDQLRLDQLEQEKSQKKEEAAKLARLRKEMKKAARKSAREMAKMEKIYRKDMSERNGVHVCSCRSRSRRGY